MKPVLPAAGPSRRTKQLSMSNLVKRMNLRRAKADLAWMPGDRDSGPTLGQRAVPLARPALFLRAITLALLALALGGVLLYSAPAQAQTATVLVKNTGQADAGAQALDTTNTKRAQAFTTGANAAGYTLSSIGFGFGEIADITTAGAHLVVTLNEEDSDGNPGSLLCTLTDPATFSGSGVNTFDAPTTDPCPTLAANKTYFAVIERVASATTPAITLNLTSSASEDAGGATGWSIGDTLRTYASTSSTWGTTPSRSYLAVVRGEADNNPPEFTDTAPTTRSVDENTASATDIGAAVAATDAESDTLVYGLTGTDASSFSIDTTSGQLKTSASLDFETDSSYSVDVTVHDGKDATGGDDTTVDATITVTISVNNKDEDGTVTLPATFTGGTAATASVSDPDGTVSSPTWRWARGNTATGSFSNISGATSASYTPVAADVGKYLRATVTYTDPEGSGKTASEVSSSTVGGSNAEPTFDDGATATRTLPENSGAGVSVVGGAITATDGDSDTLTYSLTGTDAARFEIDSSGQIKVKTGSTHSFNFEATKKSYSVTVTVRDSKDAAGAADTAVDDTIAVTIDLTNVNETPMITTTATTAMVRENSTAVLTLAASDADMPDTETWSVESGDDGGKFEILSSGALSFTTAPDFEMPDQVGSTDNQYRVTVKVTDGGGLTDTHTVTVTVTNRNEAPELTSKPATVPFAENGTGTVLDFDATDVDASTTFTFSVIGGLHDGGKFDINSLTGALTFKNPPNFEMPTDVGDTTGNNTYVVAVLVTDNGSPRMNDSHTLTVNVTDVNEAPEITSPPATRSVAENSTAVHTFAATDVDASDTQTWSVEGADDGGLFTINQTTGELTFSNAPDFETPTQSGSTNNTYVVSVKVEDSDGLSDTHELTVTVTDVNETPSITSGPSIIAKDENTQTTESIATYVATDPDATTGTMSWDLEGNDAGDFTITSTVNGTANLFFAASPDFENAADTGTDNVYDVTVRVRDNGSPRLQDTLGVAITVEDVNETPVISGDNSPDFAEIEYDATSAVLTIGAYTATDDEGDSVTWAVRGTDAGHFSINTTTGELSFSIQPDFENPVNMASNNMYEIVLEAEDDNAQGGKTGTKMGTYAVTVSVTNVDETPEITTTAASHTAPSFVEIEYDAATADLVVADLVVADLVVADYDGRDEESQIISWSRTGTDAGDFSIDTNTGVLSFAQRPNFEMPADDGGDNVYNITVQASDTASPANVRELEVVVTVTDVNERPDINEDTVPSYVEIEYDFTGTLPDVHTFTATDYDDMDTVAWSLLGTDAAYLDIGAASGILTFTQNACANDGPLPDFEEPCDDDGDGSNTYSIIVVATDDDATDQKFSEYAVVVTVTDVNEAPEFTGTPDTALTPDEHDANTDYVVMDLADYNARDEEGGVSWSLTGTDSGDFAISADGVVTFAETPNYEAPKDSGGDNVYDFNVVATDVASDSSRRNVSQAVTVTVGDVEEAGTVTLDNLSPAVGDDLTFRLTDPDGGIDLTLDSNMDPQISWDVESLATGGSWGSVGGVFSPNTTTFTYTVHENDTGKALRGVVTYIDRRGPGKSATSEATAEVTANPIANVPPRFVGGNTWSVEEGPAGRNVGRPISATDRDNDTLTYGIQSGDDAASFEINPSSGQVRTAEALDFETTSGFLSVTITLHDGRDADGNPETNPVIDATRLASIAVLDVEEDGVVTLSTQEAETGTPLTATLEDGDGVVTGEVWQWARSANGRTGWTNISGGTSSSYTPTVADEDFFLRATVTYTDRRGAGKSAEGITGRRVPSANRSPAFPSTEDGQRTVPENTRAGQNIGAPVAAVDPENNRLTYTLIGSDADSFTVVQTTGQIRTSDDLDFETKSSYDFTVEVHDGRDGMGNTSTVVDDTQAVTITVENVEEPGVVTLTTDTGTIQARAEVTATLEDDDGVTGSVGWQWARSPNGRTDWVNIAGAVSAAYTPTLEEDRGNYIRATATYNDGEGSNKTANAVSRRVGDPPPVNSAPVFPSTENGRREVEENSAGDTSIGAPVAATDLNAGDSNVNDPLAYSLTGTDAAAFTIDAGTGQIRLASGVQLDYEGKRTYRVTVQVTDGRDQNGDDDLDAIDDTIAVTVTVTNVNEAPW